MRCVVKAEALIINIISFMPSSRNLKELEMPVGMEHNSDYELKMKQIQNRVPIPSKKISTKGEKPVFQKPAFIVNNTIL